MKVKLLKKLRKDAKKHIKIVVNQYGRYTIKDIYSKKYRYEFGDDWTCLCTFECYTNSIEEAEAKLLLARRIYIMRMLKKIRIENDIKIKQRIAKEL
jgi:hypothetical protein